MIDVLLPATGRPFLDLIFTGLPRLPEPGEEVFADNLAIVPGGMLTAGLVMHRLGLRVIFEATLGRDAASRFLFQAMEEEGLSTEAIAIDDSVRGHVTVAYNQNDDRSFISYSSKTPPPDPSLVERYRPRAVMFAGLRPCPEMQEVLDGARKIGALRLADSQEHGWTLADEPLRAAFAKLDILFCNEREAEKMTGENDPEKAIQELHAIVPTLVVKQGGRGSRAIWPHGDIAMPPIAAQVVDLTGCGDNFNSAFTAALLEGCLINECLAWGNAAGSLAAQAPGGTSRRYDRAELTARVREHYGELPGPDPLRMVTITEGDDGDKLV